MTSCSLHWLWFVLDLWREEDTPLLYTIISLRPETGLSDSFVLSFQHKRWKKCCNNLGEPPNQSAVRTS